MLLFCSGIVRATNQEMIAMGKIIYSSQFPREKDIPCRVTPENPEVGEGRRKRGLEELVGKPLLWFSQECMGKAR